MWVVIFTLNALLIHAEILNQAYFESTTEDPKLWFNQLVKRLKFFKGSFS
jgi:hypothetical protein